MATMVRAHGNFVETVPMALILMLCIELSPSDLLSFKTYILHILGCTMVTSRFLHFVGLTNPPGYGKWRVAGMALTFGVYAAGGAFTLMSIY